MTLGTKVICISGVPIAGIAATGAASERQFILGDRELVRLTGLDDEFAALPLPNSTRNRASEVTVTKTMEHDQGKPFESLPELWAA